MQAAVAEKQLNGKPAVANRREQQDAEIMPTILRSGPYRIFFYSADGDEPPHVHVKRDECMAKYWLEPLRFDWGVGFRPVEMRRVQAIIAENREQILEAWNEYFGQ